MNKKILTIFALVAFLSFAVLANPEPFQDDIQEYMNEPLGDSGKNKIQFAKSCRLKFNINLFPIFSFLIR